MSYKVAVTSTDGKVVNQHFGRAERFLIFEIEDDKYKFVEFRENNPTCNGHEHDDSAMENTVGLISDCKAVITERIGPGAALAVMEQGVKPIEAPYFIEDALKYAAQSIEGKLILRNKYRDE